MVGDFNQVIHKLRAEFKDRQIIPLSHGELAVQTRNGFWLVVPSWNLDVAIGIIRDGEIEPWTNQVLLENLSIGDRVINVGANFGYYAALAAQKVGPTGEVHAIEANPVVFPFLVKGVFWSGFPHIVNSYNFAAIGSDNHDKEMEFAFDPQFIGGGNLFSRSKENSHYKENIWNELNIKFILDKNRKFIPRGLYSNIVVHGKSLDKILSGEFQVMLIDAEGSECYVIEGAKEIIERSKNLKIIMEWDPHSFNSGSPERRDSIEKMWKFLIHEQNFSIQRICPENFNRSNTELALQILTIDELYLTAHSDLLLTRNS